MGHDHLPSRSFLSLVVPSNGHSQCSAVTAPIPEEKSENIQEVEV
jgi:hypothetical protein